MLSAKLSAGLIFCLYVDAVLAPPGQGGGLAAGDGINPRACTRGAQPWGSCREQRAEQGQKNHILGVP